MEARWWTVSKQAADINRAASETMASGPESGLGGTSRSGRFYRCNLCFHRCLIASGGQGYCGVRQADESRLLSPLLGHFCSMAVDPIEKKPLHFWRPGSWIFSLGGLGCNMRCPFCQNHSISQPQLQVPTAALSVTELRKKVQALKLQAVAYTYNEPTMQAEYILKAAPELKEAAIDTVLVTNGLISDEALNELLPWIEAANVDLKSFNEQTYAQMGGSLAVVQKNVNTLVQAGVHVELTTLVVPGVSDSREEFAREVEWIAQLDPTIPLHLSRYFPAHHYDAPATDPDLLRSFENMAQNRLSRVLLGNV